MEYTEAQQKELDELIDSQTRDMRSYAHYEPGEPGVTSYHVVPDGNPEDFVAWTKKKANRSYPECPYHGRAPLRAQPGTFSGYQCRECEKASARRYASLPGRRETLRERTRAWKQANPEKVREYAREYKRRRYHEDAEYRAKEQARAREAKRRLKEAE